MDKKPYLSLLLVFLLLHVFSSNATTIIDLGKTVKSGQSIVSCLSKAWNEACKSAGGAKIVIPKGEYAIEATTLKGPCKGPVHIEVGGNLKAPADPAAFKGFDALVKIEYVEHLTVTALPGGGVFDGQGHIAWKKNDCAKTGSCSALPYNFRFNFIQNSVISGISSLNSKQFHINILGCKNLTLEKMKISAPPESLNTDGIHVGRSENIKIIDVNMETGDDCVSIGDGTKQLTVEKVVCGRGHGISIGSLGRYQNEESVDGVYIRDCTIKNAQNGVRIKTWLNSYPAMASDLRFQNIIVENVSNPIIVDQAYCPYDHCHQKIPSKVKLENISFKNVKGTSASPCVIKLVCSSGAHCQKVELRDIDLKYNGPGPAVSECCNIKPVTSGKMNPPACTKVAAEAVSA